MKVFRYVSSIPRHIDLPVKNHVQQCALVVAAPTKKRAVELFAETGVDCTPYLLNTYGSGTANEDDVRVATERPGLVFARPLADTSVYLPVMSQDEHDVLMEQARCERVADGIAAGERDRREQRALEEWENEHDDGTDSWLEQAADEQRRREEKAGLKGLWCERCGGDGHVATTCPVYDEEGDCRQFVAAAMEFDLRDEICGYPV